jgi:hypothetical protein
MEFLYVKKDIGQHFEKIPSTYRQNFRYQFSVTGVSKNEIIRLRNDGQLTERDVEIAKFLFTHTFATAEQIGNYLNGQGEKIRNRLEELVKKRVLNSFFLAEVDMNLSSNMRDALIIYCLDFGGKYLVSRYGGMDTSDWYSTVNMKGADLVAKDLVATEFFVNLHQSCGKTLIHYTAQPQMKVSNKHVSPAFEFALQVGFTRKYLIGEVVFDGEESIAFRDRILKLEGLLTTNAWRKYFCDVEEPPFLVIVAENDMVARNAAAVVNRATEIDNKKLFLTTIDRMQNPFYERGAFLIYDPNTNKMKNVIINTFKPPES